MNPDDNIVNHKNELRQRMLTARASLSREQVDTMSRVITSRLEQLEPLRRAHSIMAFASIRNEIDLVCWIEKQFAQGITILLPRVEKNGQLTAVEFRGWENATAGPFGIREPIGEPFAPELIDAVLVPGLVFDARGYRLGYGKGYYDRFLPSLRRDAFRCGLCYDFQVVDDVYPHPGDIPVDWILTETSDIAVCRD